MCVIIAKPSNSLNPSINIIRAALMVNPHGSAISWVKNGKLEVFKTLDNDEMVKYYEDHFKELENKAFIFHARIATHGSKTLKNCHGWTALDGKVSFYHNGILDIDSRGDMTDSETFLRDIYEPIARAEGHEGAKRAIKAVIGRSKFGFINDEGEIKLYGHYEEVDGVYYSNLNHMRAIYPYGRRTSSPRTSLF